MESGHKQLLFMSCDTSKVQTSDHSKNKWIFDALQLKWIKIIQALSMFLFHTYKIQRLEANDCENISFVQSET